MNITGIRYTTKNALRGVQNINGFIFFCRVQIDEWILESFCNTWKVTNSRLKIDNISSLERT